MLITEETEDQGECRGKYRDGSNNNEVGDKLNGLVNYYEGYQRYN